METQQNGPKITKSENSITIDGISVPENAEANIAKEDGKWIVSFAPKKEEPIFKEGDIVVNENKGGDVVVNKDSKWICIVKNVDGNCILYHILLSISKECYHIIQERIGSSPNWRLATEDEKNTLLVKMLERNMFWDAENKKVQTIKNGDALLIKTRYNQAYYSVVKGIKTEYKFGLVDTKTIVDHFGMNASDSLVYINNTGLCDIEDIISIHFLSKPSTDFLFQELERQKKLWWNGDEKKLEKYRFKAREGEIYWYIDGEGCVTHGTDRRGYISDLRFELGNYFETEEEANSVAPKVKELYNKIWNIS